MNKEAIYGAFIMEGLHEAGYDAVIRMWDQGCIELMVEICEYVPDIIAAEIKYAPASHSYPGVFAYEVVSLFGSWLGEHIIETGELPSSNSCKAWIDISTLAFFDQEPAHV